MKRLKRARGGRWTEGVETGAVDSGLAVVADGYPEEETGLPNVAGHCTYRVVIAVTQAP